MFFIDFFEKINSCCINNENNNPDLSNEKSFEKIINNYSNKDKEKNKKEILLENMCHSGAMDKNIKDVKNELEINMIFKKNNNTKYTRVPC